MHMPLVRRTETAKQNDVSAPAFFGDVYCRSLHDLSPCEGKLLKEWLVVKVKSDALIYFDDKTGTFAASVNEQIGGAGRFDEICAMCDSEIKKARSEPDYFKTIGILLVLHKTSAEESVERPSISNQTSQWLAMLAFPFGMLDPRVFTREKRKER